VNILDPEKIDEARSWRLGDSVCSDVVETSLEGNGKETGTIKSEAKSTDIVFPTGRRTMHRGASDGR
jgi:hypothetical protein